jgi:hypothetical protein
VMSLPAVSEPVQSEPGPVELAVRIELDGLAQTDARPGIAAIASAMARILDGRAASSKPAAARQLARALDELHQGSGRRRGSLKLVRAMTDSQPAKPPVGT